MTEMSTLHRTETKPLSGGTQHLYKFPNGYGASVIQHDFSYGHKEGLWELGVLGPNDQLVYSTPITDDVLGSLSITDVNTTLAAIAALPEMLPSVPRRKVTLTIELDEDKFPGFTDREITTLTREFVAEQFAHLNPAVVA